MKREIITTADGSHTVLIEDMNVTYHSKHGAIQESMHVFLKAGLHFFIQQTNKPDVRVFEMGFGTGLNALLTLIEAEKLRKLVYYTAVELHPLLKEEVDQLNYAALSSSASFGKLHLSPWNEYIIIEPHFYLQKIQGDLLSFNSDGCFDVIYYDAFAPTAQPQLWTVDVFKKLYSMMNTEGVLVTYCSKGDVRRAMQAARFEVEKIPGPPGKREMLRGRR